jgi:hypothetical protein
LKQKNSRVRNQIYTNKEIVKSLINVLTFGKQEDMI